jgi:hypothetical protein
MQINIPDAPFKIQLEPAYQRITRIATVTNNLSKFEEVVCCILI